MKKIYNILHKYNIKPLYIFYIYIYIYIYIPTLYIYRRLVLLKIDFSEKYLNEGEV